MLKKMVITITALMSFVVILVGCQSASQKVYKDTAEFAKDVKAANEKLTSAHMETSLDIYNQKEKPVQKVGMVADTIYQDQEVIRTNMVAETKSNGEVAYHQEVIIPTPTDMYMKESQHADFKKVTLTEKDLENFDLSPDYFELLNYLYDNADALAVEENGGDYLVTIKDKDFSLIETFGKEYNFWVRGFSESDSNRELTLRFDKNSLFMKELQASITYEKSSDYVKMEAKTIYSKWNEIKESDIKAP